MDNTLSHWLSLYPNGTYAEQYASNRVTNALAEQRREIAKFLREDAWFHPKIDLDDEGPVTICERLADAIERGDWKGE